MVSAICSAATCIVPKGQREGGTFQTRSRLPDGTGETHCVIAYSSFLKEPPQAANFGRVNSPLLRHRRPPEVGQKLEVVCVNPSLARQHRRPAGPLLPYESTTTSRGLLGEFGPATASTPWVATPGEYTGQCHSRPTAPAGCRLTTVGTARRPPRTGQGSARTAVGYCTCRRQHRARQPRAHGRLQSISPARRLDRAAEG